jgi:predicted RNA-binding protein
MNHWIFAVVSHKGPDYTVAAQDIYNTRMGDKFWGLNPKTPNLRNLQRGDKVVFYLGQPEKAFTGTATLVSTAVELDEEQKEQLTHGLDIYRADTGVYLEDVHKWEERKPIDDLLARLSFVKKKERWQAYFQGGVIRISEEDFQLIMDTVANTTSSRNWSDVEVEETVKAYFEMLASELKGETYNKTEHRQDLLTKLNNRSKGAVEFKHQNISAILVLKGLPYIDGYKPLSNFQAALEEAVDRFLQKRQDILELIRKRVEIVPLDQAENISLSDVEEDAPDPIVSSLTNREKKRSYQARKYDFVKREAENRALGKLGEEFVVRFERERLTNAGRPDLGAKVERISETRGDGAGYDVLSFNEDGSERHIEVKTSNFGKSFPFDITANELAYSADCPERYYLYRVFNFKKKPKLFMLQGSLSKYNPTPTAYKITF